MSYNDGYGSQTGAQGYGQYNPYGQAGNPYTQSENPYTQQSVGGQNQGYGGQGGYSDYPSTQQTSNRYDEPQQGGYEMSNMNGNDPNRILNEVRAIDRALDTVESDLARLATLHKRNVDQVDASAQSPLGAEIDGLSSRIMETYRALVSRVKNIKQDPQSGNPRNAPQVGKVDRRLKMVMNQYQKLERDYRDAMQDQIRRQVLIVRPDASEAELREAAEDPSNQQIFSQALISSDRRGQAQSAQTQVQRRHKAIVKIEQDMIQLAQLFTDLETLVVQQEAAVEQIDVQGQTVNDHVEKANIELDGAVKKARSARRKKWICLGIALLIIIIIVVVVVVVVEVTKR